MKELHPELHKEKMDMTKSHEGKKKAGVLNLKKLSHNASSMKSIFQDTEEDVISDDSDIEELQSNFEADKLEDFPAVQKQKNDSQHAEAFDVAKTDKAIILKPEQPNEAVSRQIFPAESSTGTSKYTDSNMLCERCMNCECRKNTLQGDQLYLLLISLKYFWYFAFSK